MSLKLEYIFKIIIKELLFEKHYHGLDKTNVCGILEKIFQIVSNLLKILT